VLGVAARPALAQEARLEPAAADLLWTFAEEDPLFDQRVRLAFILLMDTQPLLEGAGLWPEVQLLPASADDREFAAMPSIEADAPVLLIATGQEFAELEVIGECRVWVAPPPVEGSGPTAAQRNEADIALGAAFRETLAGLGAAVGECALTPDASTTQLLVWGNVEVAPANPQRATSTLFVATVLPGRQLGAGSGGGAGNAVPAVPSTGSAGLAGSAASTSASGVLLLGLLAAGLAVGALRLTREGRS